MEVNKILVGFDGSPSSKKALEYAKGLSGKLNSSVTVLTVIRLPDFSPSMDEVGEVMEEAQKRIAPMHKEIAELAQKEGIIIQTAIIYGHPTEKIINYAKENGFDLIVVGTRGLGGFKKLVIGSVAQKVVSYSKVPVIGGKHADNSLDVQEYMIMPVGAPDFSTCLRMCAEVYRCVPPVRGNR
ncbi:MAG: universal stress protein [Peptococcaceae bacterium]|nr:universal stress protein [Peptococcaceae bacterium]